MQPEQDRKKYGIHLFKSRPGTTISMYLVFNNIQEKKGKRATLYNELETQIQCKSQMKPNLLHT